MTADCSVGEQPSYEDKESPRAPTIILVGMMDSGKTTVGRRLAARLGRRFIDADKELEARCGVAVATIFELEGEDGFRRRESQLIDELTLCPGLVLATGGGAVLREDNRRLLHERGFVIYLRASLPELWHRLRHDKVRPLLRSPNPRQKIAELMQARDPLYEATAHMSVLTGRQPAERVVLDIIGQLPAAVAGVGQLPATVAGVVDPVQAAPCPPLSSPQPPVMPESSVHPEAPEPPAPPELPELPKPL